MNKEKNIKVLVFPKDVNPYQELLYVPLRKKGVVVSYLQPPFHSHTLWLLFLFIPQIIYFRLKGYTIFHLHWLYPFTFPFMNNWFSRLFFTLYVPFCLLFIKLIGFKLVWTVHNLTSHEKLFLNDRYISFLLAHLADIKIVHSKNTIPLMKELDYNTRNLHVIPLGNYIGYYPNTVTRQDARKKLGIGQVGIAFLFFGLIRSYKGILELTKEFSSLLGKNKEIKLLIAGECQDKNTRDYLNKFQGKNRNQVFLALYHIYDEEVQYYFDSADVVIFPFKNITTSSSAILAFSFGKPIIAPLIGNIVDFPRDSGIYYNREEKDGLKNAIIKSIKRKNNLPEMGRKAYDYAKILSWKESARKTYDVFKSLITE